MKAIEILYNLDPYQNFLDELFQKENAERPGVIWVKSLDSQYRFITLKLEYGVNTEYLLQTAIRIRFEIGHDHVVQLSDIYTEDPATKEVLEKQVKANKKLHEAPWHPEPNNTWYHNEKTTAYLNMVDEIAKAGYLCNAGDDYYPGYFSEIKITHDGVFLDQINQYHSRSIDHKDNYHLRKLRCFIPMWDGMLVQRFQSTHRIGDLYLSFTDHSSEQNKSCGNRIVEQILQQKNSFESQKK